MKGVTLHYKWIKKMFPLTRARFLVPISVPRLEGRGVEYRLVLRSILDLSWIDLIPVTNKNTQSVVYYLKKFLAIPATPALVIRDLGTFPLGQLLPFTTCALKAFLQRDLNALSL